MNIYISNLSFGTDEESLQQVFAEYGEVTSTRIIKDRETGRSRGFGFVEMPNDEEGQNAINDLNEATFDGNVITVNVARPKEDRGNRGGGRGGNNRGGDRYNRFGSKGNNRGGGGYNRNRY